MRRLLIVIVLFLATIGLFSQSIEYFGKQGEDIWSIGDEDIKFSNEELSIYISLDMKKTSWSGFNPKEEGLLGVGLLLNFGKTESSFLFAYKSEFELVVGNWALIYNESGDAFLLGGSSTNGDAEFQKQTENKSYITGMEISLSESWVDWFTGNNGGYYKIAVIEFSYGDNLIFTLPETLFRRINEIYSLYKRGEVLENIS